MIKATIIADSISAHTNQRITTFELEYHRYIHAELMTHRVFSRNSASSRAIPINKMIELVENNPAMPIHWGLNQAGMQANNEISDMGKDLAKALWEKAVKNAVSVAKEMQALGLHKQIVNRVLEPFQIIKVLVTATSFDNFFNLRCHKDAQPEIKYLADLMYKAMQNNAPEVLHDGEWHTPYVYHERDENGELHYHTFETAPTGTETEGYQYKQYLSLEDALKISCSCAAQVSYRKNDVSIEKAISIYDKLVNSKPVHASAFEHCATPIDTAYATFPENPWEKGVTHQNANYEFCSGNFTNWIQYRQLIEGNTCYNYTPIKEVDDEFSTTTEYL